VTVGEANRVFTFHRDLACGLSSLIAKLCRGHDGDVDLPHEESEHVEAFQCLVNYLYQDLVPLGPAEKDSAYGKLMRETYYLAERYGMNDLANKTTDAYQTYQRRTHTRVRHREMIEVYDSTIRNGTGMRWYCAVTAAVYVLGDWKTRHAAPDMDRWLVVGKAHSDFLLDMTRAQGVHHANILKHGADHRERKHENGFHLCEFHVHEPGETCHLTGITIPIEDLSDDEGDPMDEDNTLVGEDITGRLETEVTYSVKKDVADGEVDSTEEEEDEEEEEEEDDSKEEEHDYERVAQRTVVNGSEAIQGYARVLLTGIQMLEKAAEELGAKEEDSDEEDSEEKHSEEDDFEEDEIEDEETDIALARQVRGVSPHDEAAAIEQLLVSYQDSSTMTGLDSESESEDDIAQEESRIVQQPLRPVTLPKQQHQSRSAALQSMIDEYGPADRAQRMHHDHNSTRKRVRASDTIGSSSQPPFWEDRVSVKKQRIVEVQQPQQHSASYIKQEDEDEVRDTVVPEYLRQSAGARIKREEPQEMGAHVEKQFYDPGPWVSPLPGLYVKQEDRDDLMPASANLDRQPVQQKSVADLLEWIPELGKRPRTFEERMARRRYCDARNLCRVCESSRHVQENCPISRRNNPTYRCPACGAPGSVCAEPWRCKNGSAKTSV
jgi:hypothetical protein